MATFLWVVLMALNIDVQVLTQPGSVGNQTYSLAANFDPKAVILWATPQTADGSAANYAFSIGFGTYRSSTVSQLYTTIRGLDGATAADLARGGGTDAIIVLLTQSAGSATRDLEIDLVSMATGASSNVVLNWVNLHTTASIRVFMLVLGGSDIQDALVGSHTVDTTDTIDDVTVVSGFGKPELVFSLWHVLSDTASHALTGFGFAKQGEAGRCFGFAQTDGNTASITACTQRSDRLCFGFASISVVDFIARLDTTVSNWPTDGFRVLYDANPTVARTIPYLALRTTAQITTGSNTAVIAGSPPVTQDNAAGFVPKLGLLFGWNLASFSSIQTTDADQVGFGIGAYDGTTEAWAGFTEDDALGTMDSNNQQSTAKVIRNYGPSAVLQSEADGAFSGNNFQLSWNDIDTVAREYQWLAMGDALPQDTPELYGRPFGRSGQRQMQQILAH